MRRSYSAGRDTQQRRVQAGPPIGPHPFPATKPLLRRESPHSVANVMISRGDAALRGGGRSLVSRRRVRGGMGFPPANTSRDTRVRAGCVCVCVCPRTSYKGGTQCVQGNGTSFSCRHRLRILLPLSSSGKIHTGSFSTGSTEILCSVPAAFSRGDLCLLEMGFTAELRLRTGRTGDPADLGAFRGSLLARCMARSRARYFLHLKVAPKGTSPLDVGKLTSFSGHVYQRGQKSGEQNSPRTSSGTATSSRLKQGR